MQMLTRFFLLTLLFFSSTPTPSYAEQQDFFQIEESVTLTHPVSGDAMLVTDNARIDQEIQGDALITASQSLQLNQPVNGNLLMLGKDISINAKIGEKLIGVGKYVTLNAQSVVEDKAFIAAANLTIDGLLKKTSFFRAQQFIFSGVAEKDLFISTNNLRITKDAILRGDLHYYGEKPAIIEDGATILGDLKQIRPERYKKAPGFWIVGLTILGFLLYHFRKDFVYQATMMLEKRQTKTIILGILYLILAPCAALLFFVIPGFLPVSLVLLSSYILILITAWCLTAFAFLAAMIKKFPPISDFVHQHPTWGIPLLLAVVLSLFSFAGTLPYVGLPLRLFILSLGIGTLLRYFFSILKGKGEPV